MITPTKNDKILDEDCLDTYGDYEGDIDLADTLSYSWFSFI